MSTTLESYAELEQGARVALETYSNVHRGSGHFSLATTKLFEQAREIVLEYLELNKHKFVVIFCSPRSSQVFRTQLAPGSYKSVSSRDIGLPLGVCALAVKKNRLPQGAPFQPGGGTARLMSKDWVVWAKAPDRFEAGTPAIINIIIFARALLMMLHSGKDIFRNTAEEEHSAAEILYHDELDQFSGLELLKELRKTMIGSGVQVPTMKGVLKFINLDNSASTPTFTPIWNTFCQAWRQPEQVKQELIQEVKSVCSGTLGAPLAYYEVIFTSNTTEAINLAAENFRLESEGAESVVLNTLLEHSSNDLPWRMIPGCSVIRLSMNAEGFVDLNEMEKLLIAYNREGRYGKKRIRLVAMSGASNVLGVCNNIGEISSIAHRYGARLLVDGAQWVAHRKIDMETCGIDYLAFSAHKVYAPFGCGALVVRKGLLHFSAAELEQIRLSGEENAGGIAALGKALVLMQRIGMEIIHQEEQALTAMALRQMAQINGLEVYGIKDPDSSGFSNKIGVIPFTLKNKMATQVGKELAILGGIGVRTGCHCSHITVKQILKISPGLEKFQKLIVTLFPKISLPGVVRVSLGIENTREEVDTLIQIMGEIACHAQPRRDGSSESEADGNPILNKAEVEQQIADLVRITVDRVYGNLN